MIELLPTNTCPPDYAELAERSAAVAAFSPRVQLDISDGVFTPALSWPYGDSQWLELEKMAQAGEMLPHAETLRYEAHLMVQDPARIGEMLARAGCGRILAHLETFANSGEVREAFELWKRAGAREAGIAILFETPVSAIEPVAGECDAVQLMSIRKLGYQGAAYEPGVVTRIGELHAAHPDLVIEIDGGVSEKNIADLVRAGARRFGVGSAIMKAPDPAAAYEALMRLAESAVQ